MLLSDTKGPRALWESKITQFGDLASGFAVLSARCCRVQPHGALTKVGVLAQLLAIADHALPQQPF